MKYQKREKRMLLQIELLKERLEEKEKTWQQIRMLLFRYCILDIDINKFYSLLLDLYQKVENKRERELAWDKYLRQRETNGKKV